MRKPLPLFLRVLSVALCIILINLLSSGWFRGTLLSGLLTACALVLVRDGLWVRSRLRGALTIAWLYWGLSFFSNLIEATVFKVVPLALAVRSAVIVLLVALATAALVEWLTPFAAVPIAPKVMAARGLAWRIPLLALAFFVIYIAAGIAIQPWIMSFYAHRPLPSLQELLVLQFCRGLLAIACVCPWYRQWVRSRSRAVWLSAYVFTALCGWGPLLLPNRYLPGSIRLAHGFEMGAAGVVFGVLTAWMLLKARPRTGMDTASG
jgi:hypothetical protein